MPDPTETPVTPWPDWLEGLTEGRKVSEILVAVAEKHQPLSMEANRLSVPEAGALVMRLLDEARQQHADAGREALRADVVLALRVLGGHGWAAEGSPERAAVDRLREFAEGGEPAAGTHVYQSTSCVHGEHEYCKSATGSASGGETWAKVPSSCKFCGASCRCGCHRGEVPRPAVIPVSLGGHQILVEATATEPAAVPTGGTAKDEPLTHYATPTGSHLVADNLPKCGAAHWQLVSSGVRDVTCQDCLTWLGEAVPNLAGALANAVATVERLQSAVPSAEKAQLTQAVAALRRLALPDMLLRGSEGYREELDARREHAAGTLETIARLGEIGEGQAEALVAEYAAGKAEPAPEPEPAPPLPPGDYGRLELPGYRSHTGWWTPGVLAGQQVMVCTDREGNAVAEYIPGPASRFVRLPVPVTRPALGWSGDDDDEPEPDLHVPACEDEDCNGERQDRMPF